MNDMNDVTDRSLDSFDGNSNSSGGSANAELDSNATIAELKSELEAAKRELIAKDHSLEDVRASLGFAESLLRPYMCANALTEFMRTMRMNMISWHVLMGCHLIYRLETLHELLSGTSTTKRWLMMKAIVENVKSGENEQSISYKRGGAWPIGVQRIPFKYLSERNQVALVAWLYICPDYPSLDVTQLHLLQDCLRDKFRTRVLHCVNSIRKLFDSDGWY